MSPLRQILQYAKVERTNIIFASTFSVLCKVFDVFPEILLGIAVDVVVHQKDSFLAQFGLTNPGHQLCMLGGLTVIIWSCESLTEYFSTRWWREASQNIQHNLRTTAYRHLQQVDVAYFEQAKTGNIVSILNEDVHELERFFNFGINELIHLIVGTIIIGGIFFYIAPLICLISLIPVPLVFLISTLFQRKLSKRYAKLRQKAGEVASYIMHNITGILTIKSYTSELKEEKKITTQSFHYKQAAYNAIRLNSAFNPVVRMAIAIGFISTMIIGGFYAMNGSISLAAYTVLVFQTQRLLWPFTNISHIADHFERALASARRVLQIISLPSEQTQGITSLTKVEGNIIFDKVNFSYQENIPVLKEVSFHIPTGKTAAFVGPTGSGKSTLVKLLLRFYEPTSGNIFIDKTSLKTVTPSSIRQTINLVNQEPFLFRGTVRHNISYGKPDASEEEIIAASQAAEAHDFINHLAHGYNTYLAEQGKTLSGGQKQRIALARAILKDAPIFIFDEATSAVDSATEEAIQRSLNRITGNKTTIIVAHRLATIKNADTIYVLDQGTIKESGSHDTLLKHGTLYKKLWNAQNHSTL